MRHSGARQLSWPRSLASLFADRRGVGVVEVLILVVALALAAIFAVRAFAGDVGDKAACAGDAINTLTPGAARCADGDGSGGGRGDEQIPGQNAGAGQGNTGDGIESSEVIPGGDPASPGGAGDGQPGEGSQPGDQPAAGDPAAEEEGGEVKVGGEGGVDSFNRTRTTSGDRNFGGAPPKSAEDKAKDNRKKGVDPKVEGRVETTFFSEEGALGERELFGGSEKVSLGLGTAAGTGFAAADKDGVSAGGKVDGKGAVLNLQGEHTLPGGIEEKHEVDVLDVKGSLEGKAGISKDVIGATVSGEVAANLVEGSIELSKTFKIPFTDVGIEIGGSGSGSVGANIGGEATAGFFKGEDGKSRVGLSAGFKAALGLGLGGKLSLNLVF